MVCLQFAGPPQFMSLVQGTGNGHDHEELCIVLHWVPFPELGGSARSHSCLNHLLGRLLQSAYIGAVPEQHPDATVSQNTAAQAFMDLRMLHLCTGCQ